MKNIIKAGLTGLAALVLATAPLKAQNMKINFQPIDSSVPSGYVRDDGSVYDEIKGYGWDKDRTIDTRERNMHPDQRLDTLIDQCCFPTQNPAIWNLMVPNGEYEVTISVGDPMFANYRQYVILEGDTLINNESTQPNEFIQRTGRVNVLDGKLTLEFFGYFLDPLIASATLNYIDINALALPTQESTWGKIKALYEQWSFNRLKAINNSLYAYLELLWELKDGRKET